MSNDFIKELFAALGDGVSVSVPENMCIDFAVATLSYFSPSFCRDGDPELMGTLIGKDVKVDKNSTSNSVSIDGHQIDIPTLDSATALGRVASRLRSLSVKPASMCVPKEDVQELRVGGIVDPVTQAGCSHFGSVMGITLVEEN